MTRNYAGDGSDLLDQVPFMVVNNKKIHATQKKGGIQQVGWEDLKKEEKKKREQQPALRGGLYRRQLKSGNKWGVNDRILTGECITYCQCLGAMRASSKLVLTFIRGLTSKP